MGPLLIIILASIGVLALVGRASAGRQLPSNKLATFLTCAILLGILSAVLFMRSNWIFAIPAAVGALACGLQYAKLSALGRQNAKSLSQGADMSEGEALAVLGLSASASTDDIRAAHRKLIEQVHPDKGGNDYLAAQINKARDVLLKVKS
jgi:hypothetical protein